MVKRIVDTNDPDDYYEKKLEELWRNKDQRKVYLNPFLKKKIKEKEKYKTLQGIL